MLSSLTRIESIFCFSKEWGPSLFERFIVPTQLTPMLLIRFTNFNGVKKLSVVWFIQYCSKVQLSGKLHVHLPFLQLALIHLFPNRNFHSVSILSAYLYQAKISCRISGICQAGKLSPFLDASQNSIIEKRTLHKIQCQKNGLFTKFNVQAWKFQPFSGNSISFFI